MRRDQILVAPVGDQPVAAIDDDLQAAPPAQAFPARQAIQDPAVADAADDGLDVG